MKTSKKDQVRSVITVACQMLDQMRQVPPVFLSPSCQLGDDCYVLLDDATRQYCDSINEDRGGQPACQWSSMLPQMLFEHPERCSSILALVEQGGHFQKISPHASDFAPQLSSTRLNGY